MAYDGEILRRVMDVLPTLTRAVQTILASDAAHTVETAIAELCSHNTPGQPDSKALSTRLGVDTVTDLPGTEHPQEPHPR